MTRQKKLTYLLLPPLISGVTTFFPAFTPDATAATPWFTQVGGGMAIQHELENNRSLADGSGDPPDRFRNWENENHRMFWLVGGGYQMPWQNCTLRFGLNYSQTGDFETDGVRGAMGDLGSIDLEYQYKISSKILMGEVAVQLPVSKGSGAFAQFTLGLGYAWNKFKDFSTRPFDSQSSLAIDSHEESDFAYSLGASIGVPVQDNMTLEAGYRYVDAGKVKSGNSIYSSPLVDDSQKFHFFEARLTIQF